jgi:hypothetical protein
MSLVETYWSGVARRLQEEVDSFNLLIGHAGEQGRENEQSLTNLMTRLLPRSLGVGSGVLMDSAGKRSNQTDIVIYDSANQPTIMAQTTQVLFPVENVFATAEVKTTLSSDELEDCGNKRKSLHKLKPAGGAQIPLDCVFAYHAEHNPTTMAKHIRNLDAEARPDLLCVVSAGILAGRGAWFGRQDGYCVLIAPLHLRDDKGIRLPGQWDRPAETGKHVLRSDLRYPVTRLGATRNADRIVVEPGRALINFCAILLQMLADRGAIPAPSLRHYLQGTAQEFIDL